MQDCINRALIMPVAENEPIMESKLAPIAAGAGLAAAIPPGMRAMSVAVNDVVGVAGFVTPGTMVDVMVTGAVAAGQGGQNITRTILENVRVLAAGQKVQQQDQEGKPQTVSVITLLVSPEDAAKLAMGSTQGKIQLALRNTIDTDDTMPAAVLQTSLFSSGEPVATPLVAKHVAPAKPAAACGSRYLPGGDHFRQQTRNEELQRAMRNQRENRMSGNFKTRSQITILAALMICSALLPFRQSRRSRAASASSRGSTDSAFPRPLICQPRKAQRPRKNK